ncbi:MAG TPA: mechanosensitive ion channel family protein [Terracidiphilus sp.]|nr:mechanosensitive ion channel family protein [Terracidiphilus sp.]
MQLAAALAASPLVIALRLTFASGFFAQERFFGRILDEWSSDAQQFIRDSLPHILAAALIAFLLIQLLRIVTRRMQRVAELHAVGPARMAEVKTLASVIHATGMAVIGVITALQLLAAVHVNLAPLLASAGVAGIAIGLAAQTIVKDMFNGMLILIEGQFNVGDNVRIAGIAGVVESMTLRKTSVRDADGSLHIVPNSQITTVTNLSAGLAVATVNVSVDFSADPAEVTELLTRTALEIRNSPQFQAIFTADPQVLGVDLIKGSEMIFPVVFKTLPNQQYAPIREFRRRVRLALEEHKILPGDPYRVFRPSELQGTGVSASEPATAPIEDPTRNGESAPLGSQ